MEKVNGYRYKPFQSITEIRFIQILSQKVDGHLQCIIRQSHDFPSRTQNSTIENPGLTATDRNSMSPRHYRALSYVWGDANPSRVVYLGDTPSTTYRHTIRENLWQFLHTMWQKEDFETSWWIDAICLNQNDTDELSQQIPRMGEIYSQASEVLVWLADGRLEEAIRNIREGIMTDDNDRALTIPFQKKTWRQLIEEQSKVHESKRLEDSKLPPMGPIGAALQLLKHPYWNRVWIIQEIVMARNVFLLAGKESIELGILYSKLVFYRHSWIFSKHRFWGLYNMHSQWKKTELWRLILEFQDSHTTNTIDKIYGMLGLVDDADIIDTLEVDIAKTPSEVFWDTAFECSAPWFQLQRVLSSLAKMLCGQSATERIPSLEQYGCSPRTSERHRVMATSAMRILDACIALVRVEEINLHDWKAIVEYTLETLQFLSSQSDQSQENAILVGLILSTYIFTPWNSWITERYKGFVIGKQSQPFSPWRCHSHSEGEMDASILSAIRARIDPVNLDNSEDESGFSNDGFWFDVDSNTLGKICEFHSADCDSSVMIFTDHGLGFYLLLRPDLQENRAWIYVGT